MKKPTTGGRFHRNKKTKHLKRVQDPTAQVLVVMMRQHIEPGGDVGTADQSTDGRDETKDLSGDLSSDTDQEGN